MLKVKDLYFSYHQQPSYVFEGLNLTIHRGDYISIVGENGCGKSTLLRLILGFLTPTQGSITMETKNIRYVSQKNDFSHTARPPTPFLLSYLHFLKKSTFSSNVFKSIGR